MLLKRRPIIQMVITSAAVIALGGCQQLAVYMAENPMKKEPLVRSEMKEVQTAVESYKSSHGDRPPSSVEAIEAIVPSTLQNPFTHEKLTIVLGNITNVQQAPPGPMTPGVIEYSVFHNAGAPSGYDYAIRAGGGDGKALTQGAGTLILSDQ